MYDDPLRMLTEELVPRRATSGDERQAARWLESILRRYTYQVWLEPFYSFRSSRGPWALLLSLSLAGGLLTLTTGGSGFGLTFLAALGFIAQGQGWIELGWLFPAAESQNVVGVIPASGEVRQRVVVVAHYDTGPRLWSGQTHLLLVAAMAALPLGQLLPFIWKGLLLLPLVLVALGLTSLLQQGVEEGNEAGVAAALAVLGGEPLQATELWLLFAGSSHPGQAGMQAFLFRHRLLLDDARFIVLEEERPPADRLPQRGEASLLVRLGCKLAAHLTVRRDGVGEAAERVWAIARAIDRESGAERGA